MYQVLLKKIKKGIIVKLALIVKINFNNNNKKLNKKNKLFKNIKLNLIAIKVKGRCTKTN